MAATRARLVHSHRIVEQYDKQSLDLQDSMATVPENAHPADIQDPGCITNLQVIRQLVPPLADRFVIDAGCGDLTLAGQLAECGARVLAIDPDPVQAEINRATEPVRHVEFVETGAERLPVPPRSVDGVFFSYSLHHIPAAIYPAVFGEVVRVLRPEGFLYVVEPIACPLNDVMKLFHDEDRERADAWRTLEERAAPAFRTIKHVICHSVSQYNSFDHFATHFGSRSFNSMYTEADMRRPEVRDAFERLGGPDHRFQSSRQVMYLQGLKTDPA